jgi:hypothetical protein
MVKKPKKPTKKIHVKDLDTKKNPKGGKFQPSKPPVPSIIDVDI